MEQRRWIETLDAREQQEINFARLYHAHYGHGTPGHLHLILIAKLAALLDAHDGRETTSTIEWLLVDLGT